ncbi:hypothetical protein [Microbacterium schleiferi]|uniref:hypothetical protein n=1 Tax=Microbacterium schleiferi TaxID=69362 RepID=UPI00311F8049
MADRLIIDERQFLSGLTGAAVTGPDPSPQRRGKLWLLWAHVIGERAAFEAAVHRLAGRVLADFVHIDWLEVGAPVLSRTGLRRQPLPLVVASLGFDGVEAARCAASVARGAERSIGRPQRAVAEEISIIQPEALRARG